jgi:hypothetical protein
MTLSHIASSLAEGVEISANLFVPGHLACLVGEIIKEIVGLLVRCWRPGLRWTRRDMGRLGLILIIRLTIDILFTAGFSL